MIVQFLKKHRACSEGFSWAVKNCKNMNEVWNTCKPEWLIWLATREGVLTTQELQKFALFCANSVKNLMKDERSLKALEIVERYLKGECSKEELEEARAAARAAEAAWAAAAETAEAAAETAEAAAETAEAAAETAEAAAETAEAAAWAARAATWAAEAAAWAAAGAAQAAERAAWAAQAARAATEAGAAAWATTWEEQAKYIRENFKPTFTV